MENFKRKINTYIRKYDLATSEFERMAGVSNAVVNKILDDQVKNPSIETILKIADVLDCSLDELFNRQKFLEKHDSVSKNVKYDLELFRSVCFYVIYFLEVNRISCRNLSEVTEAVEEIYTYSVDGNIDRIDTGFADWFLKNNFIINGNV